MQSYPSLRNPLWKLWEGYVLAYVTLQSWRVAARYGRRGRPDPLRVAYVDPDRIRYLIEENGYPEQTRGESVFPTPKFKHAGAVRGGDWDRSRRRFVETDIYRSFSAHFRYDVPWEETVFFRRVVSHIEAGTTMWGCTTRAEFERRCAELDQLYDAIASRGYRSQRALLEDSAEVPADRRERSHIIRLVNDELTVCVGRDGELLFADGRNRLAIAKVLELDEIPVWIMARHEQWQRLRERVAANPERCEELPPRLLTHPDLEDVRPERASEPR